MEKSSSEIILGFLGIAFIVLKLTGFINWSWWWVTAPFWGGLLLALLFISIIFIFKKLFNK